MAYVEPKPEGSQARNRLTQLLGEVELLLSHLQRLPETRLARFFGQEARQRQMRDGSPVPPTWDLVYFLDRIAAISGSAACGKAAAFTPPDPAQPTVPPSPPLPNADAQVTAAAGSAEDPGPKLNDLAFLFWSRDFLAAITYPASVESIRVTRAFRAARTVPWMDRVRWLGRHHRPQPTDEFLSTEAASLQRYGVKLARRTTHLTLLTLFFIAFSVWASFMVFSGRVLMRENDALQAARKDLGQRTALADKGERLALYRIYKQAGNSEIVLPAAYCDLVLPRASQAGTRVASLQPDYPGADGADEKPPPDWQTDRAFILPEQKALCDEMATLDKRAVELKRMHYFWVTSIRPLSFLMLQLPTLRLGPMLPEMAGLSSAEQARATEQAFIGLDLATHRYTMEQMVDGLIGAILPVSYACLGTLAALFRRLGMKVDAETLAPADYGALRTSMILGVLTGTVVGLFNDVLGWGDQHGGLPLQTTALALLAGFAADRVFIMLDQLAERVFGRADGSKRCGADLLAGACRCVMWRGNGCPPSCFADRRWRSYDRS